MRTTRSKVIALFNSGLIHKANLIKTIHPEFNEVKVHNYVANRGRNPHKWTLEEVDKVAELFSPFFIESEVEHAI